MENQNFKVGDKVRIIASKEQLKCIGIDHKLNDIYNITYTSNGFCGILDKDYNDGWLRSPCWNIPTNYIKKVDGEQLLLFEL